MSEGYIIVLITVPSQQVGEQIAQHLLDRRLAACVNILPGMRSIFIWKGGVQSEEEVLLVVKTRQELFHDTLVPAVKAMHPYEVPEIIALPIVMGSQEYLDWIQEETI